MLLGKADTEIFSLKLFSNVNKFPEKEHISTFFIGKSDVMKISSLVGLG